MWATQRSAELTRRVREMGLFDRWSEIDLDQFEAVTGITCEELGGKVEACAAGEGGPGERVHRGAREGAPDG